MPELPPEHDENCWIACPHELPPEQRPREGFIEKRFIENAHRGNGTGCRCCELVNDGHLKSLLALLSTREEELRGLRELLVRTLPILGGHGRGFAQQLLHEACEAVGQDAVNWTAHPETLERRRALLAEVGQVEHGER